MTVSEIQTRLTLLVLLGLSWMLTAVTVLPENTGFAVVSASLVIIVAVSWEPLYQAGRQLRRDKEWPRPTPRPAFGAITATLAAAAALGLVIGLTTDMTPSPAAIAAAPGTTHAAPASPSASPPSPPAVDPAVRVAPIAVHIPKIDADSSLIKLGLDANRRMQIPSVATPMQAGWYEPGPAPGQTGPAVIVGHVDGAAQPGIFFRLHELAAGDRVTVERADGSVVTFVVHRTIRVAKDRFPTKEVYGRTGGPELRLITCGGSFDRTVRSYRDNVIVFAQLEEGSSRVAGDGHDTHGPLRASVPSS
ncbi:class F sortase [Amycolatopsis roodepoortensis]|uniref:class F sortase n=1 Tax=Amycolatopsis roodepoortensis TaxID=700274 RepID=UPI00214AB874|nr:class F sortase [Amycolatopsis roodepoortensis]UUV35851.1 class F sortase [Amycolatopsis roodepoortensis]